MLFYKKEHLLEWPESERFSVLVYYPFSSCEGCVFHSFCFLGKELNVYSVPRGRGGDIKSTEREGIRS